MNDVSLLFIAVVGGIVGYRFGFDLGAAAALALYVTMPYETVVH